jgi:hypothetical protein
MFGTRRGEGAGLNQRLDGKESCEEFVGCGSDWSPCIVPNRPAMKAELKITIQTLHRLIGIFSPTFTLYIAEMSQDLEWVI